MKIGFRIILLILRILEDIYFKIMGDTFASCFKEQLFPKIEIIGDAIFGDRRNEFEHTIRFQQQNAFC